MFLFLFDVASFLNNEKRIDLIRIEESAKIKILIITDPYKNRPYYKVSRVKNTDVNKKFILPTYSRKSFSRYEAGDSPNHPPLKSNH